MPTTLSDIARVLGVSKMTVSRAINNHPAVNSETRQRVLDVAVKLKYQPNKHARALATNRSFLIGIIVPDLMHSYFAELTRGVETISRPAGYQNLICNTEENVEREIEEVEALLNQTDGMIIASVLPPKQTRKYKQMIKDGARIVLIDRRLDGLRCPLVTTDNVKVGMLATEHLISMGHRKIGHLHGSSASVAEDRFEGYKQALSKYGLPVDKSLIRECGFLEHEGYEAMKAWLAEGSAPPAIFAANDPSAIGAMRAVEEAGLSVPDDIAIVGAGSIHYGDMLKVPLTTVTWPKIEMGQLAARQLFELIEDKKGLTTRNSSQVVVEPQLVVRRSCGSGLLKKRYEA